MQVLFWKQWNQNTFDEGRQSALFYFRRVDNPRLKPGAWGETPRVARQALASRKLQV